MSDIHFLLGTLVVRIDHMEKRLDGLERKAPRAESIVKLLIAAVIFLGTAISTGSLEKAVQALAGFAGR